MSCKLHPHGTLTLIEGGKYSGYEDAYERRPCDCERTAREKNEGGVSTKIEDWICACGAEAEWFSGWKTDTRRWCQACYDKEFFK